jgi:hypothetical protein
MLWPFNLFEGTIEEGFKALLLLTLCSALKGWDSGNIFDVLGFNCIFCELLSLKLYYS